jgi:predicted dinucleotide-binding enzyme
MNIGIIGAGNIGGTLARRFASLGHQVSIANSKGPESLAAFTAETGVTPATVQQVVQDKDLVVVALPQQSIPDLPKGLFATAADNTIVVDTGNYYPEIRDIRIAAIDDGMPESEWVSQQLGIPVIKAFNSITIWSLTTRGLPSGTPGRVCLSVAGDSSQGKKVILELMDQIGFDGIDAGTLADSWRQQTGAPAYCMDLDRAALAIALQQAEHSKMAEYRMKAVADAKRAVEEAGSLDAAMANAGKTGR